MPTTGRLVMAQVAVVGFFAFFSVATFYKVTVPLNETNLTIKSISAMIETTITVMSATAGKSKTFTVSAANEQDFRDKAAACVALCNERWGVTDSSWTF